MKQSTITMIIGIFGGSWITGYLIANRIISDGFFTMLIVWIISITVVGTIAVMVIGDEGS